jgi:hypothetical protein
VAPRLASELGGRLPRLPRALFGRLDDDRPLATPPGDNRGPSFGILAPARLALRTTATRPAPPRLLATTWRVALLPSGVLEALRFHRACQLTLHLRGARGMA